MRNKKLFIHGAFVMKQSFTFFSLSIATWGLLLFYAATGILIATFILLAIGEHPDSTMAFFIIPMTLVHGLLFLRPITVKLPAGISNAKITLSLVKAAASKLGYTVEAMRDESTARFSMPPRWYPGFAENSVIILFANKSVAGIIAPRFSAHRLLLNIGIPKADIKNLSCRSNM